MYIKNKKLIFSVKDTFSLDDPLANVICSGLKKFKETILIPEDNSSICYPGSLTSKDWIKVIDEMIFAFDFSEVDMYGIHSTEDNQRRYEGRKLFSEYFHDLWW